MRAAHKKAYFPALDSLRFFAIAIIILYHYFPQYVSGGFIGVDLFFVLSGFLVSRSITQKLVNHRPIYLGNYYMKRILRLWLPLFAMIALSLGYINLMAGDFLYNARATIFSGLTFSNNWWQIAQGSSYFAAFVHPSAYTHLWYVAAQMQYFIIFPLIAMVLWRLKGSRQVLAGAFLGIGVISAILMAILFDPTGDPSRIYYGSDTRAFAFFIGASLGAIWQPQLLKKWLGKHTNLGYDLLTLLGMAVFVSLMLSLKDQSSWTYQGGLFLAALASAAIVFGLSGHGYLAHYLSIRPLVLAGKRGYSLYLWYYPVYALGNAWGWLAKMPVVQWVLLALLAEFTYRAIEVRAVRFFSTGGMKMPQNLNTQWQNINWQSMSKRNYLRLLGYALIVVCTLSAVVGVVRAPAGENITVAAMQAQIAENEKRIAEAKVKALAEEKRKADIADLPGISRSVMLFSRDLDVTFLGDSILLSAATPLINAFPKATIDGKVGRQLNQSADVVKALLDQKKVAKTVVVVLGSNGPFTEPQLADLAKQLGKERRLYFVNTHVARPWQSDVNNHLTNYTKAHKNAHLIDWNAAVAGHGEWLYEDGTHCNPDGATGFMALVANRLYKDLASAEVKKADQLNEQKAKAASKTKASDAKEKSSTEQKTTAKDKKTSEPKENKDTKAKTT